MKQTLIEFQKLITILQIEEGLSEHGVLLLEGFAAKLNIGIIYLFVMPYLLAIIIGYMWYKKSKEHRKDQEKAEFRKSRIANL